MSYKYKGDSMKDCIQVSKLSKRYKTHLALNEISFNVKEGHIYALIGENGAGKSTTMKILCTLLMKSSGDVHINGNHLEHDNKKIRSKIGIVFQDNTLDEEFTLAENLYFRGRLYLSSKQVKIRIKEVTELLQLSSILNKKIKVCSGGQKRLSMIARALMGYPSLCILDEPTCGLDPSIRYDLWQSIMKLKQQGCTILFSSHYLEEANMADEVCILHEGKILYCDPLSKLMKEYQTNQLSIETNKGKTSYEGIEVKEALNKLRDTNIKNFEYKAVSLESIYLNLIHRTL